MEKEEGKRHPLKRGLDKFINVIEKVFNVILFVQLAGTMLVLGANVATRYLFNYSIVWSNNMSRYAYIFIVLLGTAVSYKLGVHAVISVAHDAAPKSVQTVFDVIHYAAMMFLSVVLIIPGIQHVIIMWAVHDPMLNFSIGIIYICVPLSAFAILLFVISQLLGLIQKQG